MHTKYDIIGYKLATTEYGAETFFPKSTCLKYSSLLFTTKQAFANRQTKNTKFLPMHNMYSSEVNNRHGYVRPSYIYATYTVATCISNYVYISKVTI